MSFSVTPSTNGAELGSGSLIASLSLMAIALPSLHVRADEQAAAPDGEQEVPSTQKKSLDQTRLEVPHMRSGHKNGTVVFLACHGAQGEIFATNLDGRARFCGSGANAGAAATRHTDSDD